MSPTPAAEGRCTVLGAGSWGTALALHLAARGEQVALWEVDASRAAAVARTRRSEPFLPAHPLPASVEVTADLAAALAGAAMAVIAVPSHVMRETAGRLAALPGGIGAPERLWVSATKGIEEGSGATPRQVLAEGAGLDPEGIVVLAGPSFAADVVAQRPTAILAACGRARGALAVQKRFSCYWFRVYTSADPLGVEIGVALKNVMAIAAGLIEGLGLGRNALGALITRGLAEVARLGVRMGGRWETFLGLAGIGDLVMTCTSELSRNYRVGLALARGERLAHILEALQMVAEGVRTCRSANELAERHGVEMPITRQVHAVLFEAKDPREAVLELMQRPLKPESWGVGP
jgi:glycerol-3-phosphate dehydrogenase (NAD(P)+)